MNPPIQYTANYVSFPDEKRKRLSEELRWERRGDTPRSEYYINRFDVPYTYGRGVGQRTYLPSPSHPIIDELFEQLKDTGYSYDVCFLNRYLNQKDSLYWHADNEGIMDGERPIITVSLGVEREIWFRPKKESKCSSFKEQYYNSPYCQYCNYTAREHHYVGDVVKQLLQNGSMCLMKPGMQSVWEHRIPKASFECGERISLTFRGYVATS